MTYTEQQKAAEALRKEGWFLVAPSSGRTLTVKALKAAAALKPADEGELEFSVFIDWFTDAVVLKSYHTGHRVGFCCAVAYRDVFAWEKGSLSDDAFRASIKEQWAELRSVYDDAGKVYEAKREDEEIAEESRRPHRRKRSAA